MKKFLPFCFLLLTMYSTKAQGNFMSINLMLLEKVPVTSHKHMNTLLDSVTTKITVIKKLNAFGGDTFFMYYESKLSLTINYSKDTLVVSALIPSKRIADMMIELVEKKFKRKKIKSYKNTEGDILKRYKWSKKDYPYRFITSDNYQGIELVTKISGEY